MRYIRGAGIVAIVAIQSSILFGQSTAATPNSNEVGKPVAIDVNDGSKAPDWPEEIWVQPVNVEIDQDSPLRNDDSFNKPPKIYVVCKRNGENVGKCPAHAGWSVQFPRDDDHEMLIGNGANDEYTLEVWDSQHRKDKLLFAIGPFKGGQWRNKLTATASKRFEEGTVFPFKSDEKHASLSLSYAGTRVWYRLVNVTIPPASPHRTDTKLNNPPQLQVYLRSNGEYYGDSSTHDSAAWFSDFPKVASNCWAVREGTKRRYVVEVWDNQSWWYYVVTRGNHQSIFNVTGLSAEQFREPIREDVGPLVDKDRASTITFERIEKSY